VKVGVHEKVPLVFPALAVNVAPAVMAVPVAVSEVIASASVAETVKVRSEFSFTEAVAGAVTIGATS
jgi:hypothetical protein